MTNSTGVSSSESVNSPFQEDWNYEETVAKVEEIVAEIESGELELAEVFDEFATAVECLLQCQSFLEQRKQKVDLLIEMLEDESESF